ncbi:MAG: DUF2157 domain-containing protein [Ferruginibacter sp.]|nr:DUF2157 domain-containing protein [Ferruginibacter sp.]
MSSSVFEQLHADGLLSDASLKKIKLSQPDQMLSVYWELKTVLYLGVLLLSGSLGIFVYKNIDTIGHQIILFFIAAICIGCFFYCFKKKLPYANAKVLSPNSFFDYVLLLGCLTLITFIGYLQFQYNVFGNRYGLATFIPMLLLFFTAYYFDHLGVLTMAITTLAAWAGIAVTPLSILESNDFNNETIIGTAFLLSLLLIGVAYFLQWKKIKSHFEFTYSNFGAHLLFISVLAALFHFDAIYLLFFLLLAAAGYLFYRKAVSEKSFYFLLILSLYLYIGLSYCIIRMIFVNSEMGIAGVYLICFYFILSAVALILFLIKMNKKIKSL